MSEVALTPETISRFRRTYIEAFGAPIARRWRSMPPISEGRRFAGMEHWLPFFYERLDTLFDYLPGAPVVFDHLAREAIAERHTLILDYYEARRQQCRAVRSRTPCPTSRCRRQLLYLSPDDVIGGARRSRRDRVDAVRHAAMPAKRASSMPARKHGRGFAEERADPNANVFDAAVKHISAVRAAKQRVVVAGWTEGSLDRLTQILAEHHLGNLKRVATLAELEKLEPGQAGLAVLPLETGFETEKFVVVAEQDILGDRLVRRSKKRKRAADFIAEVASLSAGDIVVHADHGIGRFIGLHTIEAMGAPHDCLEIHYAGDDRLFLPVENIELLSRYGSDSAEAHLDKLGGGAWQSRKARLKRRLLEMAGQLIRIAAERQMRAAPAMNPPEGVYGEFAARFPYEETDDQQNAIDAVVDDLGAGKPMDRLICGDVGFGKTEVALRATFIAAMEGFQVAIVVPTTLLARQHFKTFSQRFAGLPVKVRQASRLVGSKELAETKKGIADGTVDIVVGTHALLGSSISFKNLGLLIIDEEQHFGVKHKERLKELKSDVHVLTLSATPIPRTLQLALTGVRELSLIATPPVDRMAVRTFISPFDPLVIRETLLRERYRGGQSFYVVPRICRSRRNPAIPARFRAGAEGRRRAWPDAAGRTRRHHERLLRRAVRRAAVDHHRRIRPRHPDRQHADRAPRRHVRPGAALPAARPGRALQGARLCAVHAAGQPQADRYRRAAAESAAVARHARRRLPARQPRPRHPRRRQSAWARSSPATSRRSASSSTSRCWRKPSPKSAAARKRSTAAGRRRSPSAPP